jgi:hypothetical protein
LKSILFFALVLIATWIIPHKATIIVLPDTQYASTFVPDTFRAQIEWIVKERAARNITAVLHVGDIVEHPFERAEWGVANSAMRLLDEKIPYMVVPGNHDLGVNRASLINDYFNPVSMPWISGVMTPGHIENSYSLIDIGPCTWLVVGLEYAPRDLVIVWADKVFKAHVELPAILLTHVYLDGSDGTRYHSPAQAGYPVVACSIDQGLNDGEMLWQKLVVPNSNIRLVLCGHHFAGRRTSARPDGSLVHEVAADYQWWEGDWNGYGYLRVMEFDYASGEIRVQTYSPIRHEFLEGDAHQFLLRF